MLSSQTRILLVEDTEVTRRILRQMLEQIGCESIEEAQNGVVAWAKMTNARDEGVPFELILADWKMPGINGIDLLRKMHGDAKMPTVPFVLLTSNTEVDQVMEAIRAGVSHYLAKPFGVEVLRKKLKEAMGEKKAS